MCVLVQILVNFGLNKKPDCGLLQHRTAFFLQRIKILQIFFRPKISSIFE